MIQYTLHFITTCIRIFKSNIKINLKCIVLILCLATITDLHSKTKIHCVGKGLTVGATMFMPQKNSYPAQLEEMLDKHFTVLLNGDSPIENIGNERDITKVLDGLILQKGDWVLLDMTDDRILSGALDSGNAKLESQLKGLMRKGVRVVLLWADYGFSEKYLREEKQLLQKTAFRNNIEIMDFSAALANKNIYLDEKRFLTSIGATYLAKRLYELVVTPVAKTPDLNLEKAEVVNFYGYRCTSFHFEGKEAKVVQPKKAAKGNPWVWRARFWGHEPQLDIAMLERGYHIVYCDVSERFGNAEALAIWDRFYKLLQKKGLHKKSIMEGMSRGGVYVYNWALRYPDRVSAIYADAPVLDLKSWPGGKGQGKGSLEDWDIFKQMYGLSNQQAEDFKRSPLDRVAEFAALNIPAIHVISDKDDIVPPNENSILFARAVNEAGGLLELIHKPDVGHHPHSLVDPGVLVDFLLKAEGRKMNFAAIAAPGAEYRSGAGWNPNRGWWGEYDDIERILKNRKGMLDILFVGNSITQGIGGSRANLPHKAGFDAFQKVFGAYNWDCAGIAGDRTQNLLWRIMQGGYKNAAPKVIVLTIGVNNFGDGDSPAEITAGILEIKKYIQKYMKETTLVLTGPLPVGLTRDDPRRIKYNEIHAYLQAEDWGKNCIYAPQSKTFIRQDGTISLEDYSGDGIHLSGGYVKWAQALSMVVKEAMSR